MEDGINIYSVIMVKEPSWWGSCTFEQQGTWISWKTTWYVTEADQINSGTKNRYHSSFYSSSSSSHLHRFYANVQTWIRLLLLDLFWLISGYCMHADSSNAGHPPRSSEQGF